MNLLETIKQLAPAKAPWSSVLAWMETQEEINKSQQTQISLLLGMLEKLTPAAQETTRPPELIAMGPPKITGSLAFTGTATLPATPQAACEPQKHLPTQRRFPSLRSEWCGLCGALWDGSTWLLPQLPAPQQTESRAAPETYDPEWGQVR